MHILGYTRDDFHGMTLSEIVNIIEEYKKAHDQANNQKENKNQTKVRKGEKVTYGRAD